MIILNEADCRIAIKFLILASRSITVFLIDTKPSDTSILMHPKQLTPRETFMYIKFLKNALISLDVYMINRTTIVNGKTVVNQSTTTANLATQK